MDAPSHESAEAQFVREYVITDETFLEYVADRAINAGFAEQFWLQTDEEQARFAENGGLLVSNDVFRERVQEFFADHHDFAELYLKFFFSRIDESELDEFGISDKDREAADAFPEEMLFFMAANSEWSMVTVFRVDDIDKIRKG